MLELPAFYDDEHDDKLLLQPTNGSSSSSTKRRRTARAEKKKAASLAWDDVAKRCHDDLIVQESQVCAWLSAQRLALVPVALFDLSDPRITNEVPITLRGLKEAYVWLLVAEPIESKGTHILAAALIQRDPQLECSYVWQRQLFDDSWWQQVGCEYAAMDLEMVLRAHIEVCCEYDDRLLAAYTTGQHVHDCDLVQMLPVPSRVAEVLVRLMCNVNDDTQVYWPAEWEPPSSGEEEIDEAMKVEVGALLADRQDEEDMGTLLAALVMADDASNRSCQEVFDV